MPYIKQKQRRELDDNIRMLADKINNLVSMDVSREGMTNYALTRVLLEVYKETEFLPRNYKTLNEMMGILAAVQQEFYRKVVARYENVKCHENGEVFD